VETGSTGTASATIQSKALFYHAKLGLRWVHEIGSLVGIESGGGVHETGGAVLFDAVQQIHFP
jgi:hypothetical protein